MEYIIVFNFNQDENDETEGAGWWKPAFLLYAICLGGIMRDINAR